MARSLAFLILLALTLTACAKSMSTSPHPGGSAVTPAGATTGMPVLGTAAAGAAAGAGGGLSTKAPANKPDDQPIWEK